MLKQRRMVAEQIAGALLEAEAAIDEALAKTAALTGVMPALRRQAGASAFIGQDAIERASETIAALAEARRSIVATHKELSVAKVQMGLGAVAIGDDGQNKNIAPEEYVEIARNRGRALRAVSAA